MALDGLEGGVADVVLNQACIVAGGGFVNAEPDQHIGQELMSFVDPLCNGQPFVRQGDERVLIHGDVAIFPQPLSGIAHAGLGDPKGVGNINRADDPVGFLHHQHSFQVIFRGFHDFQGYHPPGLHLVVPIISQNHKTGNRIMWKEW